MEQKPEQTPQDRMGGKKSRKIARKLKRAAKRALQEAEKINENVEEWFSLISGGKSAFVTPHNYEERVKLDLANLSPHRDGAGHLDRPATARAMSTASKPPRMPMSARESTMSVRSTVKASTHGRQSPSIIASLRQQPTGAQSVSSFSIRAKENGQPKVSDQGADSVKFWAETVKHVNVPGMCQARGPCFLASKMINPAFIDAFIDPVTSRPQSAATAVSAGFRSEDNRAPTAGTWRAGHEVLGQRWGGLGTRVGPALPPERVWPQPPPRAKVARAPSTVSSQGCAMEYDTVRHITIPHVFRAKGRGVINQTMRSPMALSLEQLLAVKSKGNGISSCTKVMRGGPGTALLVSNKAPPIAAFRRTGELEMENRLCRSYPRQAVHGLRLHFDGARVIT